MTSAGRGAVDRWRWKSLALAVPAWLAIGCVGEVGSHEDSTEGGGSSGAGGGSEPPGQSPGSSPPGTGNPPGNAVPMGPIATAAPATGQRLTDRQYLNVVLDLFAVDVSAEVATLPLDPKHEGFRNAASSLLPSDLRIEGYATLAELIAGRVDWKQRLTQDGVCTDNTPACRRAFLDTTGRKLFRRPLSDDQRRRLDTLFDAVAKEGEPFLVAVSLAARVMLQSPEFLYRLEKAAALDDYDLASRIAFLLWNSAPDDRLLEAAGKKTLATADGLRSEVNRLLADPRSKRGLRDYVDDWLDAERLLRTSRDTALFPQWTGALAADMREEIHRLFDRIVWQEDADLLDLFRTDRTSLSPALAKLYGVPAAGTGFADSSLAAVPQRQGLLTQAGILTLSSVGGVGSSIVDRGTFIARTLLCIDIPEPPNNVPELAAAETGKSERDRLKSHREDPACAGCHNQIDPLGLAFETYDAIGAFQTKDEHGNALTGAGSLGVDGQDVAYDNVRSFIAALTRSPALSDCLSRKLLQYALARPLGEADRGAVEDLAGRFGKGGRRMKALLGSLTEGTWVRMPGVFQ